MVVTRSRFLARFVTVTAAAATLAVPVALRAPAAQAVSTNPPALWYKTSGSPTDAEITAAATRYRVVILNAWETTALHKLKALNPTITVLVYKCLSSTRSYAGAVVNGQDATYLPTGVGYVESNTLHPAWFALDTNGNRVQWGPYPGHWQMAVWNTAYQARWADRVATEVAANGWDGVLADNALTKMGSYFSGTLAGAPTKYDLQAGERALIAAAGAKLHAVGKLLIPNISEARLYPGLWADWTGLADGGMEENYAHWGTDPNDVGDYLWDWGSSGWTAVQAEMAAPGLNLAVTRSVDSDSRSYKYGLASFLIGGGGRGAFEAVDDYVKAPFRTEQSWQLGLATGAVTKVGAAYTRTFAAGFAAVNPSSTQTVTLSVPAGLVDASGAPVTSLTMGPLTGAILRGAPVTSPTPTPTPTPTSNKKWKHHAPFAAFSPLGTRSAGTATSGAPGASPTPRAIRLADQAEQVPTATVPASAPVVTGAAQGALPRPTTAPVARLDAAPAPVRPLAPSRGVLPVALGLVLASGLVLGRRVLLPALG